ncbi:MAG: bifunctional methylenetetrahydrofolate dehydrogenase/methenyltetrahydrofolate cyclohydrolase, partial [Kordiimonadaceae bacterium]|nr:bifunctional methylenetetrahydrofolate dehydrogenase/methenyltetrahydrofolate cyclohydrolase [Kordiimonadaceae bacterium]
MTASIIDGKAFGAKIKEDVAKRVAILKENYDLTPGLAVVLVGEDPASQVYVRNKNKSTKAAGMNSYEHLMNDDVSEAELIAKVKELNEDEKVHGILVQLPLPDHLEERPIIAAIDPAKDVDGLTNENAGLLLSGGDGLFSCTPVGCMMLIQDILGDDLSG